MKVKICKLYKSLVDNLLNQTNFNEIDISELFNKCMSIITKAADIAIGKSYLSHNGPTVPWWNNACKEAIKLSKKAFNEYKKHNTTKSIIQKSHS